MMKQREARRKVLIASRMQAGAVWVDVYIHNISSRGLLVRADQPPVPGTYVDIRRGTQIVIGRAVWRKGNFFGVRCQERLNVDSIINEPRLTSRPAVALAEPTVDRRAPRRAMTASDIAVRLDNSRRFASAFQFALVLLACGAAAVFGAFEVREILSRPMIAAEAAMAGAR